MLALMVGAGNWGWDFESALDIDWDGAGWNEASTAGHANWSGSIDTASMSELGWAILESNRNSIGTSWGWNWDGISNWASSWGGDRVGSGVAIVMMMSGNSRWLSSNGRDHVLGGGNGAGDRHWLVAEVSVRDGNGVMSRVGAMVEGGLTGDSNRGSRHAVTNSHRNVVASSHDGWSGVNWAGSVLGSVKL